MLLSEPLASLITFFRTRLIKFYLNSQRMSDSFYHIVDRKRGDQAIFEKWACRVFMRRVIPNFPERFNFPNDAIISKFQNVKIWKS